MSLINEALKKVQNQQGGTGPTTPPGPPVTPHAPQHTPPDKGKHRSFVWGFVVAVLIIGLVTSLLATFFVWQILGTDEPVQATEPAIVEQAPVKEPVPDPATPTVSEPDATAAVTPEAAPLIPEPDQVVATAIPQEQPGPVAQAAPPTTNLPEPTSTPSAQAVETQTSTPAENQVPVAVSPPEPQPSAPRPPDPAVVTRLQQVQIRGIMSGGIKVLIQDEFTGRTRAYRVGESLEGTMGLVVVGITPNTIQFRDYAGSIHTKSF